MPALNRSAGRCTPSRRVTLLRAILLAVPLLLRIAVVHAATVPADPASSSYQQGASDRDAWEGWFASLTGYSQAGAAYWASERSKLGAKPCASYAANGGDWLNGCMTAWSKLKLFDAKRTTDAQYWNGWNKVSLSTTSAPLTNTAVTTSSVKPAPVTEPANVTRQAELPLPAPNHAGVAQRIRDVAQIGPWRLAEGYSGADFVCGIYIDGYVRGLHRQLGLKQIRNQGELNLWVRNSDTLLGGSPTQVRMVFAFNHGDYWVEQGSSNYMSVRATLKEPQLLRKMITENSSVRVTMTLSSSSEFGFPSLTASLDQASEALNAMDRCVQGETITPREPYTPPLR